MEDENGEWFYDSFNAKELLKAVEWAIDWCARHGDSDPYVTLHTTAPTVEGGPERVRARVLVKFDDGETEFTGMSWDHVPEDPDKFPI